MPDVRSMIAIGLSGQLGLHGHLPWEGDRRPEFVADVANFFEKTRGHVLMAGPTTIRAVPEPFASQMTLVELRSSMDPEATLARFPGRVVFIGGGPKVWEVYSRYVRHWDINRLPYDGEADTWFDPQWLLAGGANVSASGR